MIVQDFAKLITFQNKPLDVLKGLSSQLDGLKGRITLGAASSEDVQQSIVNIEIAVAHYRRRIQEMDQNETILVVTNVTQSDNPAEEGERANEISARAFNLGPNAENHEAELAEFKELVGNLHNSLPELRRAVSEIDSRSNRLYCTAALVLVVGALALKTIVG